jgi:double-stranded uracil-DNA glycosylase
VKTEQINIRLDSDLAAALDRVAREESLERATAIRRLLESSIKQWELEHAVLGYQRGELSLGRAAEESGLTQWELIDALRVGGLAHALTGEETRARLDRLGGAPVETLPDIPPKPGGVLLVGINPAPISVAAGHYYQGRIGRRLWRRLEGIGLLRDPRPGAEDEAFAAQGHGLTDLVKRPTPSSDVLSDEELRDGAEALREKIREWKPRLVLCAFREPAVRLVGSGARPGLVGEIEQVPVFLLSGPYAARAESERIDAALQTLLGGEASETSAETARTQRVTATDLDRGQIRLPREAKRFFPGRKASLEVVVRGVRVRGTYDPRVGPDRERSGVLRIGREQLRSLVHVDEVLQVSRGLGGVAQIA